MSGHGNAEGWTVRAAGPADAPAVSALTRAAFAGQAGLSPPPGGIRESVATVAGNLETFGGLVLTDPCGELLAALRFTRDGPLWWVRRVSVHPAHQRRGLGAHLMAAAAEVASEHRATALRCGVRLALAGNERFYALLGFRMLARHDFWGEWGLPLPRLVSTPDEMRVLGARLAGVLSPGDVVILDGPLGAGKTVFAQGVGAGLGVTGPVTSPTFVISRRHRGERADLLHADAYRLGGRVELEDLDLDSELAGAVAVVEWGSGRAEGLAPDRVMVRIERPDTPGTGTDDDAEPRRVTLTAEGPAAGDRQRLLDALR